MTYSARRAKTAPRTGFTFNALLTFLSKQTYFGVNLLNEIVLDYTTVNSRKSSMKARKREMLEDFLQADWHGGR